MFACAFDTLLSAAVLPAETNGLKQEVYVWQRTWNAAVRDSLAQHRADPEARFHYRYQAAFLALDAARLLPDNSDETARILCTAGSWLKNRDPQTADLFYKALVRRCRKTALGAEADRKHWFPRIDEQGNLVPASEPAPSTEPPVENPNEPITDEAEPEGEEP